MYLAQLANSPPKQFRASQKNPKHGKWGGGGARAEQRLPKWGVREGLR